MSQIPGVPEFKELGDVQKWLEERFAGAYATNLQDRDLEIRKAVNEKHAPILIPQVTIDAAHSQRSLASASGDWTGLNWQSSTSTTSGSEQTAVEYIGRGILTKLAVAEVTSGGASARTFGNTTITIDGNVVFQGVPITGESRIRVIVGNLLGVSGTDLAVIDGHPGLPFNASCKITYISDGTRTLSIGWKIAKKL